MQTLALPRFAPRSLAIAIAACAAILGFFLSAQGSFAATCTFTGAVSTNFNTGANWDCAFVPGASSTAIIPTGTSTTMTSAVTVSDLLINTNATLTTTGFDLSVYRHATNTGDLVAGANTTTIGFNAYFVGGTFTPGTGTLTFATATNLGTNPLIQLPSSFTVNNLVVNSNLSVNVQLFTGTALTVSGIYRQNSTFVLGTASTTFTANGPALINESEFWLATTGVTAVFNATATIAAIGTLRTTAGDTVTFNSDLVNAGQLGSGSATYNFNRNWTNTGTFLSSSSTSVFGGSASTTIPSVTFWNLTVNKSVSGRASLAGNVTTTGNFLTTGDGAFAFLSSTLEAQGNVTRTGGAAWSRGTGTLLLSGSGAQSIGAGSGNILFVNDFTVNKPSGTATLGLGAVLQVNGTSRVLSGSLSGGSGSGGDASTLTLNGSGTSFLLGGGSFVAGTGLVQYDSSSAITVASTTFYNVAFTGTGNTMSLNGPTAASGTTNISGTVTLAVGTNVFTAVGVITNTSLITENTGGGGKIVHTAESVKITDSSGTEVTSVALGGSVYVTVRDSNRNLDGTVAETMSVTLTVDATGGSDSQTMTLTETGVSTGIFRNTSAILTASGTVTTNDGTIQLTATGVGTSSYTDNQDAADVGSDTATLTGPTTSSSGGGGGGSGAPNTLPPLVTQQQTYISNLQALNIAIHSLVKLPSDNNDATQEDTAVYYIGADGMRHAFPNSKVYFTWYANFDGVQLIGSTQLASIPLGKNVTYKPGVKMVKFTTLAKVYVVAKGGVLRWVTSEAAATELYGSNWNTKIDDISDAFYQNYTFGADVNGLADFNPTTVEASVMFPSDSLQM